MPYRKVGWLEQIWYIIKYRLRHPKRRKNSNGTPGKTPPKT